MAKKVRDEKKLIKQFTRRVIVTVQVWFEVERMPRKEAEQWCKEETASLLSEVGGSPEVVRKVILDASDVSTVGLWEPDSKVEVRGKVAEKFWTLRELTQMVGQGFSNSLLS